MASRQKGDGRGRHENQTVPAPPLRCPLDGRGPPGLDRLIFKVAAKIFGKIIGRRVASIGLLVHCLQYDRLEVARIVGSIRLGGTGSSCAI